MTRTIRTLDQCAKYGFALRVECARCDRAAEFLASDVWSNVRRKHVEIENVPFTCEGCGKRDRLKIYAYDLSATLDRKPERILWRPVKVKF